MRPEDDPIFQLCQQVDARGLMRGELGLLLKQAMLKSQLRIGQLASLLQHIHVGFGTVSESPRDLLPLPVCKPDLDETRILQAFAAGAKPADIRRDFPSAVPRAARSAWVFLLILLVNFLHLGWSEVGTLEHKMPADFTDAQLSVLEHFGRQVDYFLKNDKPLPGLDWNVLLAAKAVDYNADLVLKGRPVSWAQIEPGLPPEGMAGSVRAVSLAAPPMARLLSDPTTCVRPRGVAISSSADARLRATWRVGKDPPGTLHSRHDQVLAALRADHSQRPALGERPLRRAKGQHF